MFVLSFPNLRDAEPYKHLEDRDECREAVRTECRGSIEALGADGFDPPSFLPDNFDQLEEWQKDEAWSDAYEQAIEHATDLLFERVWASLWQPFSVYGNSFKLPDNVLIRLAVEEDDE